MTAVQANREGYKETKLGWTPLGWKEITLGEFGATYSGLSGKSKIDFGNGANYIPYMNIFRNTVIDDNYYDKVRIDKGEKQNLVKYGDVLFTTSSETPEEVGMCSVYLGSNKCLYLNSFCFGFRLNESCSVNPKYLSHFFRSFIGRKLMNRLAQGATRFNLSKRNLLIEKINFPPLPEQKKIAQILSTWDTAITHTQNLIEQLQSRKKGLMQQLLTGKKRLMGFDGEWEYKKLADIAERITKKNEELDDTVITISAQRGFVRQEDFFNKRVASATLSGYYLIEKGDFAYNKSYSNGYPMGAFKRLDDFEKAVVTTLYICFSLKDNINSDFLLNYFEGGMMIKGLSKIAQEGGRAHGLLNIGLEDFFNLKLLLPNVNEQIAIAGVLTNADDEIKMCQKKLLELQTQKKGLMQQLLTGQKRVKI